ncbi:NUDIX domain-containing protein [bacterium 3DAC]|nr:NUDIX domain-containing protein [bacterium 3DAC]
MKEEQLLWSGRFLQIFLVDGRYEVVKRPEAVGIIALDGRGNIVLVKQYRPAVGRWTVEIPAGLIDPGEDPLQTALRELREETGYTHVEGTEEYLGYMYPTVGYANEVLHFVKVEVNTENYIGQDLDEGETISEVIFMPIKEFIEKCKRLEFHDSKTLVSALMVIY